MSNYKRLDSVLFEKGMVSSRSQAEQYIKLGFVRVNGQITTKPARNVQDNDQIQITQADQYVSRGALKLASVVDALDIDFKNKLVLDVGSSTGGFTDYALRQGATKVVAIESGTNQLHPSLRGNPKIELHEQTDIRNVRLQRTLASSKQKVVSKKENTVNSKNLSTSYILLSTVPDIVLIDVSFVSLRDILPSISQLLSPNSQIIAMVKPQFEATNDDLKHKGVIKNDRIRREILRSFENWVQKLFIIENKADSLVSGTKGNLERFYKLVVSN